MPPSPTPPTPLAALQAFATRVTAAFATAAQVGAQPEVQLLAPLTELLHGYAGTQALAEVQLPGIGRPDLGVLSGGLLTGHVELKAPGKGANPKRFTDAHDRQQWIKFQNLPNLLYTDGQEWALFRTGERAGEAVRLSGGDVTQAGPAAATAADAAALDRLLRDFLGWQPYVPTQPRALAQVVAPLCRLLRDDVAAALTADAGSALGALHEEWQLYFFPEADAAQFADAYAQTLTYALLLAHVSGAPSLAPTAAAETLRQGHGLLADTLDVLGQSAARQQVKVPLELLQRTIGAVQPALFGGGSGGREGGSGNNDGGAENGERIETDPWLYFYEDFLSAYDPEMRKKRGVYYTPVEVVQAQVRLVDELLRTRLGRPLGFVDEGVATLDPACGTGTYLLAALRHGLARVGSTFGPGARAHAATTAAANLYAFELLVGPYAVAHLRLTQQVLAAGGTLPATGPHVLLADTLEAPHADPPSSLPLSYRRLGREHERAQQLKNSTPILVCLGNPPYRREQRAPTAAGTPAARHGGWVRFGDNTPGAAAPLLQDFLKPLKALGAGGHAKNLYNDYVYFWRWALWKTFGQAPQQQPGIVSFITGSSYLQGPGFAGMRQVMRETFEELWIIDLEGDSRGTRHTDNVFVIQTPVCVAVGLRTPAKVPGQPAAVHYCRLTGPAADKLARLGAIEGFDSLSWQDCPTALTAPLLPAATSAYTTWPKLTDVFPWQANGMQFKRSWPIAETPELLRQRWQTLVAAPVAERSGLLKEAESRTIHASHENFRTPTQLLPPLARLTAHAEPQEPMAYAFRSFDRQWMLPDARLCNRPRPELQRAHGPKQVYLTSLLTGILGDGPAAVATELLPDLDHFRGSFGAKHVIPLYRDAAGTQPNLPAGLLPLLAATYGRAVAAPDVLAYAYALLAGPRYGELFRAELETPGPRLPLTRDPALFAEAGALGRRLLALHAGGPAGAAPPGRARLLVGTPATPAAYPDAYRYDEPAETLHLLRAGTPVGQLTGLAPAVWRLRVSGLRVVESWLSYRLLERAGRSSSPLDALRPPAWIFDLDLLRLLWTLEATLAEYPEAARLLDAIVAGPLLLATELPAPTPAERAGPGAGGRVAAPPDLFE